MLINDLNLSAEHALEGLVSEVVPADELLDSPARRRRSWPPRPALRADGQDGSPGRASTTRLADHLQLERHGIADTMAHRGPPQRRR